MADRVTASAPGSLTLADPSCALLNQSTRYYLYGKLQATTQPGSWYYHSGRQRLYL